MSCRSYTQIIGKNGIPGTLLRRYPSCHQAKTGSLSMAQRLRALVVQRPQICEIAARKHVSIQHCDQLSWVAFASSYITAKPYARIEGAANTDATKQFDSTEPSGIVHYGWTPVSPVTQIHFASIVYLKVTPLFARAQLLQCTHNVNMQLLFAALNFRIAQSQV